MRALADDLGVTLGQLALAWLLHRGRDVVPIPGTRRLSYLEHNAAAAELSVTTGDLARLEAALPAHGTASARYPAAVLDVLNI